MSEHFYGETAAAGDTGRGEFDLKGFFSTVKSALQTKTAKLLIWVVQLALSFLTLFFFQGVLKMAYYSLFYRLDIPETNKKGYCVSVVFALIGFAALMLFTRKQIVTRLVIMLTMPLYFPIFLFNFRHLELVIPLGIFIIVTFIGSGSGEGVKTILGAVFLTFYIIGAFVFLSFQGAFQSSAAETVTERGYSQQQVYRYSIVKVDDRADGHTYVAIEPNTLDIKYDRSTWYAKGYSRLIYLSRPKTDFVPEWSVQSRAEITRELLLNNPYTEFTLDAEQMKTLALDKNFTEAVKYSSLSRAQRKALGAATSKDLIRYEMTVEQAQKAGLKKVGDDDEVTLNFEKMVELGLSPSINCKLSSLSDENLAALGIPEQCEVLKINGKVVFRQYIAVLERKYDPASREITAFLESNDVAEIGVPSQAPPVKAEDSEEETSSSSGTTGTTEMTEAETDASTAA